MQEGPNPLAPSLTTAWLVWLVGSSQLVLVEQLSCRWRHCLLATLAVWMCNSVALTFDLLTIQDVLYVETLHLGGKHFYHTYSSSCGTFCVCVL